MTSYFRFGVSPWWLVMSLLAGSPLANAADSLISLRESQHWAELRLEARASLVQESGNVEAYAALVESLWRGGATTEALAEAEKARAAGADSAALRLSQANIFALRRSWEDVTRVLVNDVDATDAVPESLLLVGISLREQGRLDDARRYLTRLTKQEPTASRGWLQLANLELAAKRPTAAQAALERLPVTARSGTEALYLTARVQADSGQTQTAIATLTHALEKTPLRASLYALRARQLANLQAWPEAARDIHSALLLGASAASDYLLACEAARMLDDNAAQAAYARIGMATYAQRIEFPLQLAYALRALGDAQQARALLGKSVKDFPGNTALALELALAQAADGQHQDVINTLDALLAKQPSAQGYALRAYAQLQLGNLVRAGEDATNALALESGLVNALLVQARVALAQGLPAQAETPCRQALARAPDLAWAHTTCGELALALGNLRAAQALIEQALRLSPQDAEALRLSAQLKSKGARP